MPLAGNLDHLSKAQCLCARAHVCVCVCVCVCAGTFVASCEHNIQCGTEVVQWNDMCVCSGVAACEQDRTGVEVMQWNDMCVCSGVATCEQDSSGVEMKQWNDVCVQVLLFVGKTVVVLRWRSKMIMMCVYRCRLCFVWARPTLWWWSCWWEDTRRILWWVGGWGVDPSVTLSLLCYSTCFVNVTVHAL